MSDRYFDVTYEDGTGEKVKPLPRSKWADLMEIQQSLLEEFLKNNLMPGNLLLPSNKKVWNLLETAVTLLPTISGNALVLDQMSADEILEVFFTATTHRDEDGMVKPEDPTESHLASRIASLHGFAFFLYDNQGLMQLARAQFMAAIEERQKKLQAEIAKEEKKKKQTPMPTP